MKVTTKIECPNDTKRRHSVTLFDDGSVSCDCADGRERGASYAGRLMLGMPPIEGARGCAVLLAMVEAADSLLVMSNSMDGGWGSWRESVAAYGTNPVYQAALDAARKRAPERGETQKLILDAVESCGYKHALGKRRFRELFAVWWDVPPGPALDCSIVSAFDDDRWRVPYQPSWKTEIFDKGLAVIDSHFVCGRSVENPRLFYAIAQHGDSTSVRQHLLVKKKLCEVLE